MDPRTARTELDRATGRSALRSKRDRARGSARRRGRGAPFVAALLVGALAAGWLFVSARSSGSAGVPPVAAVPSTAVPSTAPATRPAADTTALRAALHAPATCTDVAVDDPEIACSIAGVRVDARFVGAGRAASEYASAAGPANSATSGPPACAGGRPDERAWSRPATPTAPAGRYRCLIENGVAAMWWTDGGALVHATATTPDLAALFDWWRAHLHA